MNTTVAAVATPRGTGGIGVVRVSGPDALFVCDKIFKSVSGVPLIKTKGYHATLGHIVHDGVGIDECVALVFRAPKSYTGEDVVELSCHGGEYVVKRALRAVLDAGASPAPAGEFTKRAYLNGKIDLTRAESVMRIISASTEKGLMNAMDSLDGRLFDRIDNIRQRLIDAAAAIAYWSDDPDEFVPEAQTPALLKTTEEVYGELEELIRSFDSGKVYTLGVKTCICGTPNVGKSTLMNLLSGKDSSIVTNEAGTTRDVVEETVRLGDMLLRLSDTAGIRKSENKAEAIGIDKALRRMDESEIILAVFDLSTSLSVDDLRILEKCAGKKAVAVLNKSDLDTRLDTDKIKKFIPITVNISASRGEGRKELTLAIKEALDASDDDFEDACLTSERQRACCRDAASALKDATDALKSGVTLDGVSVMLDAAIDSLLFLTGEKVTDEVTNRVFRDFCVGK